MAKERKNSRSIAIFSSTSTASTGNCPTLISSMRAAWPRATSGFFAKATPPRRGSPSGPSLNFEDDFATFLVRVVVPPQPLTRRCRWRRNSWTRRAAKWSSKFKLGPLGEPASAESLSRKSRMWSWPRRTHAGDESWTVSRRSGVG